jgi:hypothetical protein
VWRRNSRAARPETRFARTPGRAVRAPGAREIVTVAKQACAPGTAGARSVAEAMIGRAIGSPVEASVHVEIRPTPLLVDEIINNTPISECCDDRANRSMHHRTPKRPMWYQWRPPPRHHRYRRTNEQSAERCGALLLARRRSHSFTARDLLCCRSGTPRLWRRGCAFRPRRLIADSAAGGAVRLQAQQSDASRPLRPRLRLVSALSLARMDAVATRPPGGRSGEGLSISPRGGRDDDRWLVHG